MALFSSAKPLTDPLEILGIYTRLESESRSYQRLLIEAQDAWAAALVAEAEGTVDAEAVAIAEKRLTDAQRLADKAGAALRAADAKYQNALSTKNNTDTENRWRKAAKLADERHALLEAIDASVQALADSVRAFEKKTTELVEVIPEVRDRTALLVDRADLYGKLHLEMSRHGLNGEMEKRRVFGLPDMVSFGLGIPGMVREWGQVASKKRWQG